MSVFDGNLLPVKLKIKPDEILSSWITRLAWNHGLRPQNFISILCPKMSFKNVSIDRINHLEFLEKLSSISNISLSEIKAATVNYYKDKIYAEFAAIGPNPWILPFVQSGHKYPQVYGIQFCPQCLDENPYFRLSFRLSFMVICSIHKIQLLDRCQHCYTPINYFQKGINGKLKEVEKYSPLTVCYFCKKDLHIKKINPFQLFGIDKNEIDFQNNLLKIIDSGWGEFPSGQRLNSLEYFGILHTISRLYFTTWRAKYFQYSISRYFNLDLPYFFRCLPKRTVTSSMSIYERRIIFKVLSLLSQNGGKEFYSFLNFSKNREIREEIKKMVQQTLSK